MWYVKQDDIIGGWCIMRSNMTPGEFSDWVVENLSNMNPSHTQWAKLHSEMGNVCNFVSREDAELIVSLYNADFLKRMEAVTGDETAATLAD